VIDRWASCLAERSTRRRRPRSGRHVRQSVAAGRLCHHQSQQRSRRPSSRRASGARTRKPQGPTARSCAPGLNPPRERRIRSCHTSAQNPNRCHWPRSRRSAVVTRSFAQMKRGSTPAEETEMPRFRAGDKPPDGTLRLRLSTSRSRGSHFSKRGFTPSASWLEMDLVSRAFQAFEA